MNQSVMELSELPGQVWAALGTGARVPEDPFRTAVLATASETGCAVRTVILQYASPEERLLACCSDARAGKVRQVQANPRVVWVFYDPRTRTQVRVEGQATVHIRDDKARRAWQIQAVAQRLHYCSSVAPGSRIDAARAASAQVQNGSELTELELEAGFNNFAVIECIIDGFDWLRLDAAGYRRAAFHWNGKEFAGNWLAP